MIQINELKGEMKAKGISYEKMSEKIGISCYLFKKVIEGKAPFKVDYVDKLSKELKLSKRRRDEIFFA